MSVLIKIDGVDYDVDLLVSRAEEPLTPEDPEAALAEQHTLYWAASDLSRKAEAWTRKSRRDVRITKGKVSGQLLDQGKSMEARSTTTTSRGEQKKGFRYTVKMLETDLANSPDYQRALRDLDEAERVAGVLADLRETFNQRHEALCALAGMPIAEARRRRDACRAFSPAPALWGGKEEETDGDAADSGPDGAGPRDQAPGPGAGSPDRQGRPREDLG